jgi:cell division protein FtsL
MTPPTTYAARERAPGHARRTARRTPPPRRISGPAQPKRDPRMGGTIAARPPLSLRLGATAMRVGDARLLDRLVRGRAWIALMAIGLIGIVFMQVSLLKLNAGISRAVTAADTLERQNSSLRTDISNLDSGERIQDVAAKLGMSTPAAGDVHYLDAGQADATRAAASIKPPAPVAAATTPAAATQPAAPAAAVTPAAATQPAASAATTAAPAATAPAATAPATTTGAPAATAAATPTQQQTPPSVNPAGGAASTTTTTTAPPAATGPAAAVAGGASAPQGQG